MRETADSLARFGYLVGPEIPFLRKLASMVEGDPPVIINIGGGTGTSAFALLEGNPRAKVVTVDNDVDCLEGLEKMIAEAGYADRHSVMLGDSIACAGIYDGEPARMVFFDCGRHEYDYLKTEVPVWDTNCYEPWIAAFHDAVRPGDPIPSNDPPAVKAFTEVTQFVAEFEQEMCRTLEKLGHERLLVAYRVLPSRWNE